MLGFASLKGCERGRDSFRWEGLRTLGKVCIGIVVTKKVHQKAPEKQNPDYRRVKGTEGRIDAAGEEIQLEVLTCNNPVRQGD